MTNPTVTPSKDASPRDREAWGSELGFILAAVGSAVGLGNMWRFSATAASSGGAGIAAPGLPPAFSLSILGTMNSLVGEVFLAVGVLVTVIIVGWFMDDPVAELAKGASPTIRRTLPVWHFAVRWVLPVITGGVLVSMVRAKLGI